ncbi:MAG: InlB B-repeat-containing protein, partial [Candidatus Bathyarchaeota archaeon]|nr:InlB B-repeat-containing protein [Candidatus Termiticorpusculum sp.]
MIFNMGIRHNMCARKLGKQFLSLFCLFLSFMLLIGIMLYAIKPVNAQAGVFTFTGFDPETTIIDSSGDVYKIPGADCIRIYFDFESQANHKYPDYTHENDLSFDPVLYRRDGAVLNIVSGVNVVIKDFTHYDKNPLKYFKGTLEIYDLDAMIPLGIYHIRVHENDNVFSYYGTLTLSTTITAYHKVCFFDWSADVSDFTRVPSMYGEQMVKPGDSAIAPPIVRERYGYSFEGWDKSFNNVQGSLNVYAVYAPNTYTVTFDANADTHLTAEPNPKNIDVTFDSAYGLLATVNRDHYTFDGWFTINDIQVTADTILKLAEDHTLYAHWTPIVYTITYELADNELYPGVKAIGNPAEYTVESNFPINIAAPTRFAYDFQGWTITYADMSPETLPSEGVPDGTTGNIILTANWTPTKYNIIYDLGDDGVNDPTNPNWYTVEDFPISHIVDPPDIDRYVFMGWTVKCENGSTVPGLQFDYEIPEGTTGDITLIAQWIPMGKVSKTIVDGSAFNVNNLISYDISYAYELPDDISDFTELRIIDSWSPKDSISYVNHVLMIEKQSIPASIDTSVDGVVTFVIDPADLADNDGKLLTLKVTFTVNDATQGISNNVQVLINNVYIGTDAEALRLVHYDANWPIVDEQTVEGSGNVPDSYLYEDDSKVTVAGNVGVLAVDDWVFIGWSMTVDGSSDVLVEGDTFTVEKDTLLYAQWVPSGGVIKVLGGSVSSYELGEQVEYVVSYTIPNGISAV